MQGFDRYKKQYQEKVTTELEEALREQGIQCSELELRDILGLVSAMLILELPRSPR